MSDLRRFQFTQRLHMFSLRLDELLRAVRREPHPIPLELLDEIAITIGELTVLLCEGLALHQTEEPACELITRAEMLRHGLRAQVLSDEQIAAAVTTLTAEVGKLVRADKQAA